MAANGARIGVQDPNKYASANLLGAINASLAGIQMRDPKAIATVNSISQLSETLMQSGMIDLDTYNTLMTGNVQKIN